MPRRLSDASFTRSRAYTLAVGTIVTILVLQMVTSVAGAIGAARQFEQVSIDTFEYVGELTAERVARFAETAKNVAEGTATQIELVGADADRSSLEMSLYQRLKRADHVRAVYVGWPDGEFLGLQRHDEGYQSHRIGGDLGQVATIRTYTEAFELVSTTTEAADFDPRERPWYQTGAASDTTRWSEPYLDFEDPATLVSAAHAARLGDEVVAVVGADLNLNELSNVLDELPYGEGAEAFVLTQQLQIIAAPIAYRSTIASAVEAKGGVARAQDIGLGIDPEVVPPGTARFSRDFDQIVLDRSFAVKETLPWRLHMRASDKELSAGLGTLGDIVLWITAFSVTMVTIASGVVWWVRRPLNKMRERAMTDPLTGLLNRREFHRRGAMVAERAADRGEILMVTVLDLDDFKDLNDQYGHGLGDRALAAVAAGLKSSARAGDLAARLGGDEFVVLHVLREGDRPLRVAQRLRDAVEHEIHTRVEGSERVGVTAGYTTGGAGVGDLDRMVEHADTALVTGKRDRKGRVYAAPDATIDVERRRSPVDLDETSEGPAVQVD
ncbi:MAG: diguanylate cyclase [Demequina sp.]